MITPGQTDEAENEAALNNLFQSRKDQDSPVHLLVQLDRIPSKKDRFDLKKYGIELLSYGNYLPPSIEYNSPDKAIWIAISGL